jgi:hypothetical protein
MFKGLPVLDTCIVDQAIQTTMPFSYRIQSGDGLAIIGNIKSFEIYF